MKAATVKQVIIYSILSIAALLWALPIWWSVINATKSTPDFFAHPFYNLPREFDLFSNIRSAWDSAGLGTGFVNSPIYGVAGAAASILIASAAAYGIVVLRVRGGFTIFMMIFSGTVFPLQMYISRCSVCTTRSGSTIPASGDPFLHGHLGAVLHAGPARLLQHGAGRAAGGGPGRRSRGAAYPALGLRAPSVSAALVLFLFQFTWIWNDLLFGIVLSSSPTVRPVMASLSSLMGLYGGSSLPVELAGTLIAASPMLVLFFGLRRFFTRACPCSVEELTQGGKTMTEGLLNSAFTTRPAGTGGATCRSSGPGWRARSWWKSPRSPVVHCRLSTCRC